MRESNCVFSIVLIPTCIATESGRKQSQRQCEILVALPSWHQFVPEIVADEGA
jgi:hypothetical protein